MIVSGNSLSLFGRTALSGIGGGRASQRQAPEPVDATDPLKDTTSSEYRELQELKARDQEVRQHEQAHVAAGGQYVRGGASYSYQRGPDGQQYATGGEVDIDASSVPGDPAATIRKMQVVRGAALAPAEPSAQDRAVAAEASRAEAEARVELREEQAKEREGQQSEVRKDDAEGASTDVRNQPALDTYRFLQAAGFGEARQTAALDLIA
jgi:hypothetical protein